MFNYLYIEVSVFMHLLNKICISVYAFIKSKQSIV